MRSLVSLGTYSKVDDLGGLVAPRYSMCTGKRHGEIGGTGHIEEQMVCWQKWLGPMDGGYWDMGHGVCMYAETPWSSIGPQYMRVYWMVGGFLIWQTNMVSCSGHCDDSY